MSMSISSTLLSETESWLQKVTWFVEEREVDAGASVSLRTSLLLCSLFENPRPASPANSSVSMASDWSMGKPEDFRKDKPRPASPDPSDVYIRNDWSKEESENCTNEEPSMLETPRPASPAFSSVSMKSDRSMGKSVNFRTEGPRPASPAPSDVTVRSDESREEPLNFGKEEPSMLETPRPASPAFSSVSMKSDRSMGKSVNFRTEGPRPASPAPSDVTMRSDESREEPLNFGKEEPSMLETPRPASPAFSSVSMKSDRSMGKSVNFRTEGPRPASPAPIDVNVRNDWSENEAENCTNEEPSMLETPRPASPAFSSVSMKSDRSMGKSVNFRTEGPRPASPAPSDVTVRSDESREEPLNFGKEEPSMLETPRPASPAFSSVSMKSDRSMGKSVNFRTEGPRPASPAPSDVTVRSDESREEPLNFGKEEPSPLKKSTPVTSLPVNGPTRLHEDDPLDFRQENNAKRQLTEGEKKRVLAKYDNELHHVEWDSKLCEIVKKREKVQTYNEVFINSKGETVRTVLTKGLAGVGKTFHTKMFMVDWAKGKSNQNINLIFPLHFSELNARRHEVQSMEDLLFGFLTDAKQREICSYDSELAFVLDGLENCELPLDFKNNKKVTDKKETAPMDVLLTNLIKGNLLPTAYLWIISQSSAVKKIPPKYVQKVTECREIDAKETLAKEGKNRILAEYENELRQVEVDSELLEVEEKRVQTYNGLFMKSEKQKARTVLTKGVAGVGKSFQTKMLMLDWARGKSNKDIDLIVPFPFSELNARRHKVQSMEDLLFGFLTDAKQREICNFDSELAFVLDGLENCELPLDFKNNKKVTDKKEAATMDVLLTNLIKGNLLPTAHLWIISQPSAVTKIPPEYIEKVTECRETLKRRQVLESNLRKRLLRENSQVEDVSHPNQINTEHIMRKTSSAELTDDEKNGQSLGTKVNVLSDLFKEKNVRTILTVGEAGVGKSFHVQKFVKAWAKKDKTLSRLFPWNNKVKVVFPLNIWEFDLIKDRKFSLVELLHHFFKETKESVISDYALINIVLVLDGLDRYPRPLDFDNNDTVTDVREAASMDVLLTNLIRGKLLPSAKVWITSRPSAAKQLPDDCIHRMTEIREKPDVTSRKKVKSQLKDQFNCVAEGIDGQKTSALLNEIYTDLYIIEGERGEVNKQHESRQVQHAKFNAVRQETPIKYCDIFKPPSDQHKHIKTVLTIGVAGIGKTFASMKYMLDWAEGEALENIYYIFPLPFRELNLRRDEEHSLEELLYQFFPAMKNSEITNYDKYQILIVLDGFDECRLDLEFSERLLWTDVRQKTSVNVLLTNLIMGNLLPKAQIWITSRPGPSNNIPAEFVDRVTEVRGFNDEQKEEYFRKRFSDKSLAEKILSHVKKSRSLYIMCHIPVFCWITSKVLEDFVSRNQEEGMPKTMTDMYVHFLLLQCRQANVKYGKGETGESSETDSCWNTRNKETILSLGKLAFEQLEKGNLFTEDDLTECGIDITKAVVFSGVFTQIKREGHGLYEQKLFCFVHLSIQEFLAAFYVFHTFNTKSENLLTTPTSVDSNLPESDFYKRAVDKALGSQNGDWDLFLRFLLGLSLETNQHLLKDLLKKTENEKETYKETVDYIKKKISEGSGDADKNLNLFHCLNELNDHSLVNEIKKYLQSEAQTFENFSASQWSALTFVLLTSDENLEEFDLKKYRKSEEVLLGMLPVVKVSKTSLLSWCNLSEQSCNGLTSSVLCSASSNLTELDLSHNDLKDSGVQRLADGLKSLHCKLENLQLSGCQVTEKGCSLLASGLKSNTASHLKQLDLSYNHPGDNVEMTFSAVAPHLKLSWHHCGEQRLKPGLKKYGAHLKLDENTASRRLVLTKGNRKVETRKKVTVKAEQPHSEERFKRSQVFCDEAQTGLCYWEVEWEGTVGIAVAYKEVGRKWDSSGGLGCNAMSWSLLCSRTVRGNRYTAMHGETSTPIEGPHCKKIAVLLDWEGGTLSYYSVSSGGLSLIHTFHAKFTDPLFPGFWFKEGSVTLCDID